MLHESGFLAKVFEAFARYRLSVDLITTSQTNITVTLDPKANYLNSIVIDRLLSELNQFSRSKQLGPYATISLVGQNLRAVFQQLLPALEELEETKIHLISQSASDLNFTFAVDENRSEQVVSKLHMDYFSPPQGIFTFGKSWAELIQKQEKADVTNQETPLVVQAKE